MSAATATWLRMVGGLMPVIMVVATVATADHYPLDVVAGVLLALAGLWVALVLERRRERRHDGAPGPPAPPEQRGASRQPAAVPGQRRHGEPAPVAGRRPLPRPR